MKFRLFSVFPAGMMLLALWLGSCDKLDPPYATIAGQDIDTTNRKTILLEDYTGIKCVNCPTAALTAHALENQYKHKVVVMAVHAGYYAQPDASGLYTADYRTPEGTAWFNDFGLIATPMGMVNRVTVNASKAIICANWSSTVQNEFQKTKEAHISINAMPGDGPSAVEIRIATTFLTAKTGAWAMNVCVTEDSIVSPQKNNDPNINNGKDIDNYVHMGMLRKTLTGDKGIIFTRNPAAGTYSCTYFLTPDPAWKQKNLSVVAFVSDSATRTILQAGKISLGL